MSLEEYLAAKSRDRHLHREENERNPLTSPPPMSFLNISRKPSMIFEDISEYENGEGLLNEALPSFSNYPGIGTATPKRKEEVVRPNSEIFCGWLFRKTAFKWKQLFARLSIDGILSFHKDEETVAPLIRITIQEVQAVTLKGPSFLSSKFEFRITHPNGDFTLGTKNSEDRSNWIVKLKSFLKLPEIPHVYDESSRVDNYLKSESVAPFKEVSSKFSTSEESLFETINNAKYLNQHDRKIYDDNDNIGLDDHFFNEQETPNDDNIDLVQTSKQVRKDSAKDNFDSLNELKPIYNNKSNNHQLNYNEYNYEELLPSSNIPNQAEEPKIHTTTWKQVGVSKKYEPPKIIDNTPVMKIFQNVADIKSNEDTLTNEKQSTVSVRQNRSLETEKESSMTNVKTFSVAQKLECDNVKSHAAFTVQSIRKLESLPQKITSDNDLNSSPENNIIHARNKSSSGSFIAQMKQLYESNINNDQNIVKNQSLDPKKIVSESRLVKPKVIDNEEHHNNFVPPETFDQIFSLLAQVSSSLKIFQEEVKLLPSNIAQLTCSNILDKLKNSQNLEISNIDLPVIKSTLESIHGFLSSSSLLQNKSDLIIHKKMQNIVEVTKDIANDHEVFASNSKEVSGIREHLGNMQVELQEVHKKICEDEILLKREDSSKNLFVEKFGSRINDLHQICQALRNDQQKLQTHAFSSTEDKSGLESIKQKLLHFETLLGSLNSASSNTNSPTHYYSKLNEISFSMESQRTQLNHLTNKLDSTFTTLVQTQSEINSTPRTTPCPSPTKSRRDTFNETRLSEISNSLLLIQDKISELTHKIAGTKVSETKLSGNHELKEITKVLEKIEESKKFNQECITVSTNNLKNEISRLGKAHDEERNVESVERVFNGFKQDQAALNKNILESYMDLKNEIDRVRQVVSSDDSTKILDYLKELNMNIVPRVKSIEEDLYQLNHGFKTDMALYSSNLKGLFEDRELLLQENQKLLNSLKTTKSEPKSSYPADIVETNKLIEDATQRKLLLSQEVEELSQKRFEYEFEVAKAMDRIDELKRNKETTELKFKNDIDDNVIVLENLKMEIKNMNEIKLKLSESLANLSQKIFESSKNEKHSKNSISHDSISSDISELEKTLEIRIQGLLKEVTELNSRKSKLAGEIKVLEFSSENVPNNFVQEKKNMNLRLPQNFKHFQRRCFSVSPEKPIRM